MATLAAIGGRWLRADATPPVPELMRSNSAFSYVGSFAADLPRRRFRRRASTAESPEEWLASLRKRGTTDLQLITNPTTSRSLPPHLASAFSNAGGWALLATGEAAPELWTIRWEVEHQNAEDSGIWALHARSTSGVGAPVHQLGLSEARAGLRSALEKIRELAVQTDEVRGWSSGFEKSMALLEDPAPAVPYYQDLLPADASLERRQLAAAVVQGWVFGGMGSWNDSGFVDPVIQREHEQVTADLYAALLFALPVATNGA